MAIKQKMSGRKMVVDLDVPNGNAFALLGLAKNLMQQLPEYSQAPTGADLAYIVLLEMKSGDYKNLVKTFQSYFGGYIDFETNQKDLLSD